MDFSSATNCFFFIHLGFSSFPVLCFHVAYSCFSINLCNFRCLFCATESRRETLTSLPPTPSSAALQKMTYSSWDKFMTITYQKPSAPSPPPPDSSDSPDQITQGSTSHYSGERFCSGFKRIYYDSSLSIAENDNIRSMVDYNKKESSPPPPPSASTSPVTVAKPSDSSPPSPSSSESPIQIPHNSPQIPTIASS